MRPPSLLPSLRFHKMRLEQPLGNVVGDVLKREDCAMTYVASPTHSATAEARRENLKQCLDTARKWLEERSRASDTEKRDLLIADATFAGWSEDEVQEVLDGSPASLQADEHRQAETHQFGVVPSSSI